MPCLEKLAEVEKIKGALPSILIDLWQRMPRVMREIEINDSLLRKILVS